MRLLPQAVYSVLGPWPYVATGLYLLHRLSFLLIANPYYYRVYLIGLALLSIVLLALGAAAVVPPLVILAVRRAGLDAGTALAVSTELQRGQTCEMTDLLRGDLVHGNAQVNVRPGSLLRLAAGEEGGGGTGVVAAAIAVWRAVALG